MNQPACCINRGTARIDFNRIIRCAAVAIVLGGTVPAASAQTLVGAIDLHAHGDPDGTPRKIDVIDLARAAKAAGMRAIVIKNHYEPTASLAYIVRKEVPGIEVFGGISLDLTVGGVNPAAVEWMTKVKGGFGKVIWLPTFDSEAQVKLDKQNRPFAPVTRDGTILPEVLHVIALAVTHDLVLETGHSAPRESLMIIAEAKKQGVTHVLVTHAMTNPGGPMSLDEMRQAAKLGALLELVYSPLSDAQLQKEADAIRTIGAASFVLSSDLGQPQNPLHTEGLLAMYKGLMAKGISAADIDLMSRKNPARLLGLETLAFPDFVMAPTDLGGWVVYGLPMPPSLSPHLIHRVKDVRDLTADLERFHERGDPIALPIVRQLRLEIDALIAALPREP